MNRVEKHSYYSFVALYLGSAFLFLSLSAYWYYNAQKASLESIAYYKMVYLADRISAMVIQAHMHASTFKLPMIDPGYKVALYDDDFKRRYGSDIEGIDFARHFSVDATRSVLVSTGTNAHLGIEYVVVESALLQTEAAQLRSTVLRYFLLALLVVSIIAFVLSKLFLRPLRRKIAQVERFIKDVSHELNTPITALSMSSSRAMQKGICDERTLRNISASTKQLYDIYTALTYLNFSHRETHAETVDIAEVAAKSVEYFRELAQSKTIGFEVACESMMVQIDPQQASMLLNNLLSNAIKYSRPDSTVAVTLHGRRLSIKDEGIGIASEKLGEIFERYRRGTDYAGGFGVGLSIVKSICDANAIAVMVDSTEGSGTTVTLEFPV